MRVAKQIVTMTENAIFVAHNVRFDYRFIREEFVALGYTYTRKQLCTVVLSRKSFPGLRSYSLDNLIRHFGISVENRHRAMDDALATVDILGRALALTEGTQRTKRLINAGIEASHLPKDIHFFRTPPQSSLKPSECIICTMCMVRSFTLAKVSIEEEIDAALSAV